jgi:hypothetical protein
MLAAQMLNQIYGVLGAPKVVLEVRCKVCSLSGRNSARASCGLVRPTERKPFEPPRRTLIVQKNFDKCLRRNDLRVCEPVRSSDRVGSILTVTANLHEVPPSFQKSRRPKNRPGYGILDLDKRWVNKASPVEI